MQRRVRLILLAVFTVFWSSLATAGWADVRGWSVFLVGAAAGVGFVAGAVAVLRGSRRYPAELSPDDAARAGRTGRAYGIVFAVEGAAIGVAAGVLGATGRGDYVIPTVALVVGLHFLPMARVFGRTVDYWIGGWVVLVAATCLTLLATGGAPVPVVWAVAGTGTTLGTAAYGVYMLREGRRLLRLTRTG